MGDNKFLVEFQHLGDKEKVLKGRSWVFDRNLVNLQEFDGSLSTQDIQFTYKPLWIHMHNIPMEAMTHDIGSMIGSSIGKVISMDADRKG